MDKHKELNRVDITNQRIQEVLRRPSNFMYHGDDRDVMFVTWAIGPTLLTRDSTILEQSNAAALVKHLNTDWPELVDDWRVDRASHWAVGWVDQLVFRAVEDDEETPTTIFKVLELWFGMLQDYPIANDSDYSEREYVAAIENIETELRAIADLDDEYVPASSEGFPDDCSHEVFSWLWDNDPYQLDNRDGHGAYPERKAVARALCELNYIKWDNNV